MISKGGSKLDNGYESLLDVFIYETTQNIEQLEQTILNSEKTSNYSADAVNEIFRIMHTIKGSSSMMMYNNMALLAHTMEDLFYFIREEQPESVDYAILSDMVLEGVDFIKLELEKVKNADNLDGDPSDLIERIRQFLSLLKGEKCAEPLVKVPETYRHPPLTEKNGNTPDQKEYEAVIFFEDGCQMENIRAFAIIHNLKDFVSDYRYFPDDIIENTDSVRLIREQGFKVRFRTEKSPNEMHDFFENTAFVRDLELIELSDDQASVQYDMPEQTDAQEFSSETRRLAQPINNGQAEIRSFHQNMISVDVVKLDKLMDLMGEMVIAEAMVTQNPELRALKLNNFYKAARQLRKITGEMQDMVMSIRMVPLSATLHKMYRIVRDMSRKLDKEVDLKLIGEETEVDKNIIEHISDPLMHLIRNSVDHGIEDPDVRTAGGKTENRTDRSGSSKFRRRCPYYCPGRWWRPK